jgi:hypothetical protein
MEWRGWLAALAASAAVAGLGCVTHPTKATPVRVVDAGTDDTGPPAPAKGRGAQKPYEGWFRRTLSGLNAMPWYRKILYGGAASFLIYEFTRHDGGGGATGSLPQCGPFQHWNARDHICEDNVTGAHFGLLR